ncbi:MAG: RNA polymerase sigma-70 factor [Bacteroidia bacterium]
MNSEYQAQEETLLNRLKTGDMKAFETLYKMFHKMLWHYAKEMLKDEDEAEDTVQQLFIRIWEKRDSLLISTSFKSYLFTSVRNACLKKMEKAVREKASDPLESTEMERVGKAQDPAQFKDLQLAIQSAIESLPERCRLIFKLSRYGGLTYTEIAKELELSVKTVENQMSKALQSLRQDLKHHFSWLIPGLLIVIEKMDIIHDFVFQ